MQNDQEDVFSKTTSSYTHDVQVSFHQFNWARDSTAILQLPMSTECPHFLACKRGIIQAVRENSDRKGSTEAGAASMTQVFTFV